MKTAARDAFHQYKNSENNWQVKRKSEQYVTQTMTVEQQSDKQLEYGCSQEQVYDISSNQSHHWHGLGTWSSSILLTALLANCLRCCGVPLTTALITSICPSLCECSVDTNHSCNITSNNDATDGVKVCLTYLYVFMHNCICCNLGNIKHSLQKSNNPHYDINCYEDAPERWYWYPADWKAGLTEA